MLKSELLAKAKELGIKGRSKLTKPQLIDAIKEAGGDVEDDKKGDGKQKKIDQMYKVENTTPAKKVVKKADPSPKMQNQKLQKQKMQKQLELKNKMAQGKMQQQSQGKMPKMAAQLKAKMVEVAAA